MKIKIDQADTKDMYLGSESALSVLVIRLCKCEFVCTFVWIFGHFYTCVHVCLCSCLCTLLVWLYVCCVCVCYRSPAECTSRRPQHRGSCCSSRSASVSSTATISRSPSRWCQAHTHTFDHSTHISWHRPPASSLTFKAQVLSREIFILHYVMNTLHYITGI